jgi:zinc/manganese transport system permease protein
MFSGLFAGFMTGTWLEASIMAVVAGAIGFFVVLRGSTFAAHAIPQGAFTGAAGAALIGANTFVGIGVFSLLGALGTGRWARRGHHDVATALSLVALLGTGSLFLSLSNQYSGQTFALLFGQPIGLGTADLWPTALLGLACLGLVLVLYRRLVLCSVAPDLAAVQGVSPSQVGTWFLVAVAVATTTALPVVGALLVFSLMTGPPAAARAFTARPWCALLLSAALALVTAWLAVATAFWSDWPIGFFVGGLSAGWFVVGRIVMAWTGNGRRKRGPGAATGRTE